MFADNSQNPSIKSPASSHRSLLDNNEPPPPFSNTSATALIETSWPPSFPLSVTLAEADQRYPPVLPRMATRIFNSVWASYGPNNQLLSAQQAEDLLLKQEDLGNTICATAYGLVSTIHCYAAQFNHQL